MAKKSKNKHSSKGEILKTLDLHGYAVDEVFDAVDRFIMQCNRGSLRKARILTGKGTGAVKKETLRYLKLGNYPFRSEKLPSGAANPGSLIIFLDD